MYMPLSIIWKLVGRRETFLKKLAKLQQSTVDKMKFSKLSHAAFIGYVTDSGRLFKHHQISTLIPDMSDNLDMSE